MPALDSSSAALLLELAASDDLQSFRATVDQTKLPVNTPSLWYCRCQTDNKPTMGFQQRTPLMIAAMYGSISVLDYILSTTLDVNHPSASDAATALHCAAAGGASTSPQAIKLLLNAAADVAAVDAAGKKPIDVLPRATPSTKSTRQTLELLLGGETSVAAVSPATPKKEYPVDVTLPDIKSGVYVSDEFRMYSFKVKLCSRAYSHDWTECPFVHPGENARRRDPRKYTYSCVPCLEFRKGTCRNGDACEYAHGVFESWLHPAQYRTRLCKDETGCNRRVCFFAHKPEELRCPPSVSPVSSPRAGVNLPPLDLSSMSPSSTSALAAAVWLNQTGAGLTPVRSRLKSAFSARDFELDLDGYQQQQQQLLDEFGLNLNSNLNLNSRSSDYGENSLISGLQSVGIQKQQLRSGYATGALPPSSPSARPDHSLASAIINSRASAFAKRSQSFIDRGAAHRAAAKPVPVANWGPSNGKLDWGSPNGKLDWGIQGEEINKLRKSASFAIRSAGAQSGSPPPGFTPPAANEPDVSWVQSVLKDGPSLGGLEQKRRSNGNQYHVNSGEMFPSWADQLYMEQEQMVA